jgi:NADPH:quinone reductase-like Zn-dependent oxidoreductase
MGYKTINIVRRESLIEELKELGADLVFVQGPEMIKQIREVTKNSTVKLGLDAIAGIATNTLAQIITEGGVIVSYGALSLENIQLNMGLIMSKDISLHTFWLVHWLRRTPMEKIQEVYQKLIGLIIEGKLIAKIDSTYNLQDIKNALAHAMRSGRDGKVLLTK